MDESKNVTGIEDRKNSLPTKVDSYKYKKGAVTFLDVLGWKGIWRDSQISKEANALETLSMLVGQIDKKAKEIAGSKFRPDLVNNKPKEKIDRGKGIEVKTLSISDTIVILTPGLATDVVSIHCELCSWALNKALKMGLPLRGAISYGIYDNKDNIMIGPAVDEAASWHESTDWIGVVLTPSVYFELKGEKPVKVEPYKRIPYKNGIKGSDWCVDWNYLDEDNNEIHSVFSKRGPLMQDVAPKYLNTMEFLNSKRR